MVRRAAGLVPSNFRRNQASWGKSRGKVDIDFCADSAEQVGKGMREASKFARPSDMKEKRIKEEEARLKEEEARLKEEIPEIQRDEL